MLHRFIQREANVSDMESSSDEENDLRAQSRLNARHLRDASDPFSLPETEFRGLFRLSRIAVRELLDEMLNNNPGLQGGRSNAIPFHLKLLGAMNFFGHGSYQKPTGKSNLHCQSQPAISRGLHLVLKEILKLASKYIRFPATPEEISLAKNDFFTKFQMPGIIGAIDGTHIAIVQPNRARNGHLYYNRKAFYSLNVLAVCNAKQMIVFANAKYAGSVHDSAIWQMSNIEDRLPENAFLLGDSGFPCNRCILTPVPDALPETKAENYNMAHKRAQNIIERTVGCFKMRFRCMMRHRTLHYEPEVAGKIVYACIILHYRAVSLPLVSKD